MKSVRLYKLLFLLLLSNVFLSTASAQVFKGELEVLVEDDFKHQQSKTIYQLQTDKQLYPLDVSKLKNKNRLKTGQVVRVDGQFVKALNQPMQSKIRARSMAILENHDLKVKGNAPRQILTLLLNFTNMRATDHLTVWDVDSILYTGEKSFQKNIEKSSFGQVHFVRDSNGDRRPDIFIVNLAYEAKWCNTSTWSLDALKAIKAYGIDPEKYLHHLFVVPGAADECRWGGKASLGCGTSHCKAWVKGYDPSGEYSKLIYTHELGHNLGMSHSATDLNNDGKAEDMYGDAACIMGVGDYKYIVEPNAPHRDLLKWFDAYPDQLTQVQQSGQYTIYPLEQGVTSSGALVLKIEANDNLTYYASYRKNWGPFGTNIPNYTDKVSIHRVNFHSGYTYFVKSLARGESFVDSENHVIIRAMLTGGDTAVVRVEK